MAGAERAAIKSYSLRKQDGSIDQFAAYLLPLDPPRGVGEAGPSRRAPSRARLRRPPQPQLCRLSRFACVRASRRRSLRRRPSARQASARRLLGRGAQREASGSRRAGRRTRSRSSGCASTPSA